MKRLTSAAGALCLMAGLCAAADQFYLVDKSGDKYGPIEFKEGAAVTVGKQTLQIAKVMTEAQQVEERLREIRIPDVNFEDVNAEQVVAFLNDAVHKYDTNTAASLRLNVILDREFDGSDARLVSNAVNKAASPRAKGAETNAASERLSLKVQGISAHDLMRTILPPLGMKHIVRGGMVLVVDKEAPDTPILTRGYVILPTFNDRIRSVPYEEDAAAAAERAARERDEIKEFFAGFGVTWPRGSKIKYIASQAKLVVANTEENLKVFENVLSRLNVTPNQLEIEMQFVAFAKEDVARLAQTAIVDVAALTLLRGQGRGELVSAPKVVTQSGQEATVKSVTEYIYPTEFVAGGSGSTNTNAAVSVAGGAVVPSGLETREVGTLFTVLPEMAPDGSMINLTFTPQLVSEPEWKDYGGTYSDLRGKERTARMEVPFFHTVTFTTSVSVRPGETILVGGGMPAMAKDKIIYGFITARQIGIDGKPLPPRALQVP